MGERVLVSVVMITYGHEKYIRQAIEGVLMQQGDFDLELVIANDCSPDNTDAVVQDVLSHHSNAHWIRYVRHEKNIGMIPNFIFAIQQATGKYIALCDGDDYWTDKKKLQKQVDFLEANSKYVIHSGKAQIIENNKLNEIIGNPLSKNTYLLSDFLSKNNLITCTVMFRTISISGKCFKNLFFGDWTLYVLLLARNQNLAYVSDEIYSAYRVHNGGAMQTLKNAYENDLAHLKQIIAIKKHTNIKYCENDLKTINLYCLNIFKDRFLNHKYVASYNVFSRNFFLTGFKVPFRKYLSFIKHNRI